MGFTTHDLQRLLAKEHKRTHPESLGGAIRESDLHAQILDHCRRQGWLAFHGSMAHSTFRTPGEPDFIIAANGGRWFAIECKSRSGKLSLEQRGVIAQAERIGHTVHVVRSFGEFLKVVTEEA